MKKYLIGTCLTFLACASVVAAQNYTFSNSLYLGSTGTDVVNLQTWLMDKGFTIPAVASGATAKGYYGAQTKTAVAAYQSSVGLPATGSPSVCASCGPSAVNVLA